MRNIKSKIIIAMWVLLCVMVVGYSAFNAALTITGTANIASEWKVVFTDITEVSKTSGVIIKNAPSASGTSATFNVGLTSPGDKIVYKITLANQGTIAAKIQEIEISETDSPAIIFDVSGIQVDDEIKQKTTKTFNVTIEYDSSVTSQPEKINKSLTLNIITVQSTGSGTTSSDPNVNQMLLSNRILSDNVAYADNVSSPYVTASTGINFGNVSSDTNGRGLYYTSINTEDNKKTYYFRGTVENNYVKFGKHSVDDIKYRGYSSSSFRDFDTIEQCNNDSLYNDNCHEYIYAKKGDDILWRIVRINEDGSIRLIIEETGYESEFNENFEDNASVGYMYGKTGSTTYEETHANTNDSTIKEFIDDWYVNNLSNYSSYLADAGFCNDRSVAPSKFLWNYTDTALGYGENETYYGPYNRLSKLKQPQFACPNANNDLFTTSTSTKGNKALTYPIGLITTDEVAYAGGVEAYEADIGIYLENGKAYWTMSPHSLIDNFDLYIAGIYAGKSTAYGFDAYVDWSVRPVINLQSNVQLSSEIPTGCTSQNGTKSCPYIIKTN